MANRFPTLSAAIFAGLLAVPMVALGQQPQDPRPTTPAPMAPAATAPARPAGAAATSTSAMPTDRASRIIGAKVYNERNEAIGDIDDLILPASGQPMTAVLSVGGFLGIGARLVSVPLTELNFNTDGERWVLNGATRETLQARPAFTYQRRT